MGEYQDALAQVVGRQGPFREPEDDASWGADL
jgi:hypothetical protein